MTPEEETASAIVYRDCEHDGFPCRECMVIRIAAALRTARQEEREACAQVAESWHELPDEVTDMPGNPTIEKIIGNAIRRARAQERGRDG